MKPINSCPHKCQSVREEKVNIWDLSNLEGEVEVQNFSALVAVLSVLSTFSATEHI